MGFYGCNVRFPRKTTARPGHVVDLDKVILKALTTVPLTQKEPRTKIRSALHLAVYQPIPD